MIHRAWSGVLAAAWLSVCLAAQSPRAELRGEGFVLRGQLSSTTLRAVACDLETAVSALRPSLPTAADAPKVEAVSGAREIREWLPQFRERGRGNPLGAYWRGLHGDHIVVRVDAAPAERLRRVLHEYAHFVTHLAHPDPAPWLDEGTSEIWEHAKITAGSITIGSPAAEHLKLLRAQKNWIPLRELLAANAVPTRTSAAWRMFYAESWALAHYLLIQKGGDLPSDETLRAYVMGTLGAPVTISTSPSAGGCGGAAAPRLVAPLAALLDRAQALADGERPDAARPLLREALALAPDDVEAMETIGFVEFIGNRPAEAAAVFDRIIAAGKGSHISYYYRAVLAGPIPDKTGGGGRISEVDYVRKALALNPRFAPAVQRLKELTRGRGYLAPLALSVRH